MTLQRCVVRGCSPWYAQFGKLHREDINPDAWEILAAQQSLSCGGDNVYQDYVRPSTERGKPSMRAGPLTARHACISNS